MRLILALPRLLTLDGATLQGMRSLARVARWAGVPRIVEGGLDAAMLIAAGAQTGTPVAPLASLGAGFDPGPGYVLRADPVALIAGRDDVLLKGRVDDLTAEDTAALLHTLNRHFAADGIHFHTPRPDAWFVTVPTPPRLATTPLSAVRGATYPHQPRGEDAKVWRQWMSEMQMLLHDHPVNAARETAGRTMVTGIWLSEGGIADAIVPAVDTQLFATEGAAGNMTRGLALRARVGCPLPPAEFSALRALPATQATIVVLDRLATAADAAAIEDRWLAPAVDALEGGVLDMFTLLATGTGSAFIWTARRPSAFARIRARLDPRPFELPVDEGVE